jgi:hypothetical protein
MLEAAAGSDNIIEMTDLVDAVLDISVDDATVTAEIFDGEVSLGVIALAAIGAGAYRGTLPASYPLVLSSDRFFARITATTPNGLTRQRRVGFVVRE